jgi:hypothetical protein
MIDTHLIRLRLRLPPDKYEAWTRDLQALRVNRVITYKGVVGKLNHTAFLIPLARHFLTRLRGLIDRVLGFDDSRVEVIPDGGRTGSQKNLRSENLHPSPHFY